MSGGASPAAILTPSGAKKGAGMMSNCGNSKQSPGAVYGDLNRSQLMPSEIEVLERYADAKGKVYDPDVDFLLRKIAHLRQIFGELVANSGDPKYDGKGYEWAAVPTEELEQASVEAIFTEQHYHQQNDGGDY